MENNFYYFRPAFFFLVPQHLSAHVPSHDLVCAHVPLFRRRSFS